MMCTEEHDMCAVCGRSDREVCTGFSGSAYCRGQLVYSANDRVVGRDLMCSCVHTFVIVRTECTL